MKKIAPTTLANSLLAGAAEDPHHSVLGLRSSRGRRSVQRNHPNVLRSPTPRKREADDAATSEVLDVRGADAPDRIRDGARERRSSTISARNVSERRAGRLVRRQVSPCTTVSARTPRWLRRRTPRERPRSTHDRLTSLPVLDPGQAGSATRSRA